MSEIALCWLPNLERLLKVHSELPYLELQQRKHKRVYVLNHHCCCTSVINQNRFVNILDIFFFKDLFIYVFSTVAQQANSPPSIAWTPYGCQFMYQILHFWSSCLLMGLSRAEWPKSLGPCFHVGDLEETPSSWLQTGPAPVVAATWGSKQQMKNPFLCFSFST